jgi:hypothetical protein
VNRPVEPPASGARSSGKVLLGPVLQAHVRFVFSVLALLRHYRAALGFPEASLWKSAIQPVSLLYTQILVHVEVVSTIREEPKPLCLRLPGTGRDIRRKEQT